MSQPRFDPDDEVRPALEAAGWFDDYRRDPDEWLDVLANEGFSVNNTGRFLLQHLGGLTVAPRPVDAAEFGSGDVVFEPVWSATGESDRIRIREGHVGTTLCPVGEWCGEYVLLAGGDGCIYAETTFQLVRIGTDIMEALRAIVLAERRPVEI